MAHFFIATAVSERLAVCCVYFDVDGTSESCPVFEPACGSRLDSITGLPWYFLAGALFGPLFATHKPTIFVAPLDTMFSDHPFFSQAIIVLHRISVCGAICDVMYFTWIV